MRCPKGIACRLREANEKTMLTACIPDEPGLRCPKGTDGQLRSVEPEELMVEFTLGKSDHKCPNAVSFGKGPYCFTLLLRAFVRDKFNGHEAAADGIGLLLYDDPFPLDLHRVYHALVAGDIVAPLGEHCGPPDVGMPGAGFD